jgi:hypothetical protein
LLGQGEGTLLARTKRREYYCQGRRSKILAKREGVIAGSERGKDIAQKRGGREKGIEHCWKVMK